jgi:hypothetical protein
MREPDSATTRAAGTAIKATSVRKRLDLTKSFIYSPPNQKGKTAQPPENAAPKNHIPVERPKAIAPHYLTIQRLQGGYEFVEKMRRKKHLHEEIVTLIPSRVCRF